MDFIDLSMEGDDDDGEEAAVMEQQLHLWQKAEDSSRRVQEVADAALAQKLQAQELQELQAQELAQEKHARELQARELANAGGVDAACLAPAVIYRLRRKRYYGGRILNNRLRPTGADVDKTVSFKDLIDPDGLRRAFVTTMDADWDSVQACFELGTRLEHDDRFEHLCVVA